MGRRLSGSRGGGGWAFVARDSGFRWGPSKTNRFCQSNRFDEVGQQGRPLKKAVDLGAKLRWGVSGFHRKQTICFRGEGFGVGKVSEGFGSWWGGFWGGFRGFGGEDFGLSWEGLGFRGGLRAFVGRDSGFRGEDLGFRGKNFGRSREEIRAFVGLRAFVGIWVFGGVGAFVGRDSGFRNDFTNLRI